MEKKKELLHNFDGKTSEKKPMKKNNPIVFVVIILLGIATGFLISRMQGPAQIAQKGGSNSAATVAKGQIVGSPDEKTFKDQAEGMLKEGGIEGEGAYHLERPGGESQNVYLTSSSVDLKAYIGHKVKVWGQTQSAKRAGWLMDVGRLQVL